jgi:iron-sulfur cluster repair protein YtfE (RIC family)
MSPARSVLPGDGMYIPTSPESRFASIKGYLSYDHDEIGKMLDDLACFVGDGERERAESAFDEFRSRLERHMRLEEDTLFPMFEASIGLATRGPTFAMRLEHIEIGKLVEEMAATLERWRPEEFAELKEELERLLAVHDEREETAFGPWIDRLMGDEAPELAARLERTP